MFTEHRVSDTVVLVAYTRAYSSILGHAFEWKVKGHFLEKKGNFLCKKCIQDPKPPYNLINFGI